MATKWLRSVWSVWLIVSGLGLSVGLAHAEVVGVPASSVPVAGQAAQVQGGTMPLNTVAPSPGAEGIILRVVGIGSFDDYAGLLNYLARVTAIKAANPIQVIDDEVTLQLKMQGNAEQLVRQFALENRLTPVAPVEGAISLPLKYRWSIPKG